MVRARALCFAIAHCVPMASVIMWFAISLGRNESLPAVLGGPDMDCVANTSKLLHAQNLTTTHLISIGGWDAPHPDTGFSATEWWATWKQWNQRTVQPDLGWEGFDGFDWDVEGVDNITSPQNAFTLPLLKLMGDMSKLAREEGYVTSLTPCESYLDVSSPYFDLSLTHAYVEWPKFAYHGANTYAYLLAEPYGDLAFDIVNVQLYESWSHANWQINVVQVPAAAYLQGWARQLMFGWWVDFDTTYVPGIMRPLVDIPSQWVNVSASRLVIGLANGWTGKRVAAPSLIPMNVTKALMIWPGDARIAYDRLQQTGTNVRGFMYWDIADEGRLVDRDSPNPAGNQTLWMAQELNTFLGVRQ
eukprot:TRINITY_DN8995_c0_g1_i5.p1 TRINITY_DN8995_c0_g1~~TRINITY_DN8995_c0_g1_i5.p1  ORF type:complete len:359 (+),score=66.90 TRINITY_DN8995_c0_g1_i5:248-1324(+)